MTPEQDERLVCAAENTAGAFQSLVVLGWEVLRKVFPERVYGQEAVVTTVKSQEVREREEQNEAGSFEDWIGFRERALIEKFDNPEPFEDDQDEEQER